jgi:uncharacterized membrane protein
MRDLSTAQKIGLGLAVIGYVSAGALHFIKTGAYLKIMPPYIPYHLPVVYVSGCFEILGGLGLIIPQARRAAAWGVVVLLIMVFPANFYMATNPVESGAASIVPALLWEPPAIAATAGLMAAIVYQGPAHGRVDAGPVNRLATLRFYGYSSCHAGHRASLPNAGYVRQRGRGPL